MNYVKRITLFGLFLLFHHLLPAQEGFPLNGPPDKRAQFIAFTHANIQCTPQKLLKDATLIIKEGKIVDILAGNAELPKEAKVINLNGRYIYPSFIDLYSSYGLNAEKDAKAKRANQYANNKPGAYAWNDAVHVDRNAVDLFEYDEKKSQQYLSAGFGLTLSILSDGIFRGTGTLALTGKGPEHQLILKKQSASGQSFQKGSSRQDYPGSAMGAVALIRQTYYDAQYYQMQSKEVNLSFDAFNALKGLPVIFESENKLATLRAAKIAKEFGQKYIIKTKGDDYQRLDEIKATGFPLILPLNFPKPFDIADAYAAHNIHLADLMHWEMAPANAASVYAKGIPFAFTMDGCQSSEEFFTNLRKAIQAGLPKDVALAALTTEPAKQLAASTFTGTLEKGKMANFFISNQDIFDNGAEVLDHYTLGNKNAVKSWGQEVLQGMYNLSLPQLGNRVLDIKDAKSLEAKLYGSDTLKVNLSYKAGFWSATFTSAKPTQKTYRLLFWANELGSNQQVQSINGQIWGEPLQGESFVGKGIGSEPKSEKAKTNDSLSIQAQVLYPFTEFGSNQLPQQETFLFTNVTLWTNESLGIAKEMDVLVAKGKIAAIGKGLKYPGARVIDGKGKHLTNGIIDEHSHIAIYRGVNECTQNITAEVRIGDVVNSEDINIYRQLSGGVIACQQLHGSCNPVGGQSSIIKLRWGMSPEEMKIKGADGFIKFALGENVKQSNWGIETSRYPQTRMGVEQVYYDAFLRAKEYEKKMKENPQLTRRDLEMDALVEILQKKRFISCHSYVQSEINMLMHVGDSLGFTVNTFTHILEGYKVADKMKAHGASASTFADWWAYKYEVIEAIPQNAAILNKMGIVTAVNSDDAEMGRRLNQEAAKMVKYGKLSEEDAWKMVTLNPAKMLHLDKFTGSIAVGKDADLVLWSDNPLSIYAKAEMTLIDGICYYSLEKDKALRAFVNAERERLIQKMMAAKQKGERTSQYTPEVDVDYHCDTVETY
jgi:imidazolonepropionase-like amidohydrolase